jgi:hypothetical protein
MWSRHANMALQGCLREKQIWWFLEALWLWSSKYQGLYKDLISFTTHGIHSYYWCSLGSLYIYMIFQTNIMYLNKMYQGILFHRASWFYWFSVWHPFRWFAYSFIPLPCMLPLRKHSRLADIHSEFKQFELWQECLNLSLWHYTIYYIFRPNLNTLQKIRKKVSLSRLWNIPPIARNYDIIQYHTKIYSYHSETYRPNAIFHTSSGETWRQNIGNLMVDSHPIGNDHPLRIVRHILLRCQWTYG